MCITVIGKRESGSVVFHNDFISIICFTGSDKYVQWPNLRIHTVFYCILHYGLQGQWRNTKQEVWGIVVNKTAVPDTFFGDYLTNTSLRQRFGLKVSSSGMVSRIIRDAVEKKLIRPFDPDTAPRYMKYIPIWA